MVPWVVEPEGVSHEARASYQTILWPAYPVPQAYERTTKMEIEQLCCIGNL